MSKFYIDWWLVVPSLLLSIFGLTIIYGTIPRLVSSQGLFIAVAVVAFLLFTKTDYASLAALHVPIYVISLLFLLTPFLFGILSRGAYRWLQFGQFFLQPSEVAKPFVLLALANLAVTVDNHKVPILLIASLIPAVIIFAQPDLGSALVLLAGLGIIILSKAPGKLFLTLTAIALLLLPLAYYTVLKDYQRDRIQTFLNPYHDPLGNGYHVIQSIIATGSGGVFGRGLGHGSQSDLRFLPEYHTDFVFASLSESYGFIGSALIIVLFLVLFRRIYAISQAVQDEQAAIFCLSVAGLLAFQTLINIGMNIGISPVTGITLPLVSYGGSSLLSLGITLGLINNISSSLKSRSQLMV